MGIDWEAVFYVTALVVLIASYLAAKEFVRIAERKGYHEGKYFWWCFLFPAAGYAMVIALPVRTTENALAAADADELPDL